MANTLRIKRRAAGGAAGAPASLANAELAFNEQDNTLYYGSGTGGAGGGGAGLPDHAGVDPGGLLRRPRRGACGRSNPPPLPVTLRILANRWANGGG